MTVKKYPVELDKQIEQLKTDAEENMAVLQDDIFWAEHFIEIFLKRRNKQCSNKCEEEFLEILQKIVRKKHSEYTYWLEDLLDDLNDLRKDSTKVRKESEAKAAELEKQKVSEIKGIFDWVDEITEKKYGPKESQIPKKNIRIWQLPLTAKFAMQRIHPVEADVDLVDYVLVWSGEIGASENWLDACWEIFNIDHPKDYHARSLSVGDLIQDGDDFYLVDSFGFKQVNPKSWRRKNESN